MPNVQGHLLVALAATPLVALFGPFSSDGPVLNDRCPVMTEEAADPAIIAEYHGKQVAFCCDRCIERFRQDPQRYVDRLPQFSIAGNGGGLDHEADQEHAHDHASDHDPVEHSSWFGRVHPAIVHFPIAGIPLALLGFVLWVVCRHEAFAKADIPPLFVSGLAAVAAVITGNIARDTTRYGDSLAVIAEKHQFTATMSMSMSIVLLLAVFRIWRWNSLTGYWRWLHGTFLVVALLLLSATGYWGASLVYGPGHLNW